MGVIMDKELIDEINYEIQLLIKIGFYSDDEILEIIDDEFIEEDISKDLISNLLLEKSPFLRELHKVQVKCVLLKELIYLYQPF